MILHIFQYQIDKNTRLDTQNVSRTQKNRSRVVKTLRIVWCFTLVFAVVFLALGINSLVTMGPFSENEAATLLPFGAAIAFTVISAISAVVTFFLTFLGFVVPSMSKIAPKVSGYMIDANKENIQNVFAPSKTQLSPCPSKTAKQCSATTADKKSPKTPHSASTVAQNNHSHIEQT